MESIDEFEETLDNDIEAKIEEDDKSSLEGFFSKFSLKKKENKEVSKIEIKDITNDTEYEKLLKQFIDDAFVSMKTFPKYEISDYDLMDLMYPDPKKIKLEDPKSLFDFYNRKRKLYGEDSIESVISILVPGEVNLIDHELKEGDNEKFVIDTMYYSKSKTTYVEFSPLFVNRVPNKKPAGKDKNDVWEKCANIINSTYVKYEDFVQAPVKTTEYYHPLDWNDLSDICDPGEKLLIIILKEFDKSNRESILLGDGSGNSTGVFNYKGTYYEISWDHESSDFSLNVQDTY